jgi:hypothetical protein
MRRSTKIGLAVLALVTIIPWLLIFRIFILPLVKNAHANQKQMLAGQKYMDSLTEKDFQIWTERT